MDRLLDLVNFFSIILMATVLFSVRRERIRVEYSVTWLAASIVLFLLTRSSAPMRWLSEMLALPDTTMSLVIIVFGVFLVVFYRFTIRVSALKDANVALAQRVAILEYQITSIHEKQGQAETRKV